MLALQTREDERPQRRGRGGYAKTVIGLPRQKELLPRIGPGGAVENRKGHAAPMQVVMAGRIAVDLDVHYNCVRLLNLPYLSQLNAITESRREVGAKGVVAHVSRGHAWHEKK